MTVTLIRQVIVDIADLGISGERDCTLITYALGSCIGVAAWDPQVRVGGLLHFMLPESTVAPDKARVQPAMFADTGIPLLFTSLYALGADPKRLVIKAAGAAQTMGADGVFNIGRRNHLALRKILWRHDILIAGEDMGGCEDRTMKLEIATGRVIIKTESGEYEL